MAVNAQLDRIIGHLGCAAIQRAFCDDKIIMDHVDAALEAAREVKRELNEPKQGDAA